MIKKEFEREDKMVCINNQHCILGRSIASRANDIVIYQPVMYGSDTYKEWIKKKEFPKYGNKQYNSYINIIGNKAFLTASK